MYLLICPDIVSLVLWPDFIPQWAPKPWWFKKKVANQPRYKFKTSSIQAFNWRLQKTNRLAKVKAFFHPGPWTSIGFSNPPTPKAGFLDTGKNFRKRKWYEIELLNSQFYYITLPISKYNRIFKKPEIGFFYYFPYFQHRKNGLGARIQPEKRKFGDRKGITLLCPNSTNRACLCILNMLGSLLVSFL